MRRGRDDRVARSVQRGESHLDQSLIGTRTTAIHAPRHISITRVTLHLRPKQSHILQKLETHGFVKEKACKKHRVRSSIFRQHRTSKWQPRGEGCSPQSCFVFRYDPLYTFNHYVRFWAQRKLAQRRHSCNGWRSFATEDVMHYGNLSGSTLENGIAWFDYSATRVSQLPVCPLMCSGPEFSVVEVKKFSKPHSGINLDPNWLRKNWQILDNAGEERIILKCIFTTII